MVKSNLAGAPAPKDSLPLILGLHPWSDGATVEQLPGIESSLMQYEGGWEDLVFLTVALENGNNLGTWWDGGKVNGVPTTWAMDAIVGRLKVWTVRDPGYVEIGKTGRAKALPDVAGN